MFDKSSACSLPPHQPINYKMVLQKGQQPLFGLLYIMSQSELAALKEYIDEMLAKGYIWPSTFSASALVAVIKKKDGSLHLCIDYCQLNKIKIKNRYILPLINETLDHFRKAKYYTNLDFRWRYNQNRIKEGEECKTAFQTHYNLFEYLVMPFELINAPTTV